MSLISIYTGINWLLLNIRNEIEFCNKLFLCVSCDFIKQYSFCNTQFRCSHHSYRLEDNDFLGVYQFLVFDYMVMCMYCGVKTITIMLYIWIISSYLIVYKNNYRQVH